MGNTASGLWACAPADAGQVVAVVDWARRQGWTVRARGHSHGSSPLTITPGTDSDAPVLLVDATAHLTAMTLESTDRATVRGDSGACLEGLLTFLEGHGGCGASSRPTPSPGRDLAVQLPFLWTERK